MPVNLSDYFPFNQSSTLYDDTRFEYYSFPAFTSTWNVSREFCWVVPTGVTSVKFEIWGGGGGGGAACCCAGGQPGGSGAYAYKFITTTPGTIYCANVGGFCHPTSNQSNVGHCGEKTFVIGSGLSNFCAEGGTPGITNCYCHWGNDTSSACCDYRVCNWTTTPNYYGADGGAVGLNGYYQLSCCGTGSSSTCGIKQLVPFPGGVINRRGGWFASVECADAQGIANYCYMIGQWLGGYPNICQATMPGLGAMSARSCGGGCCNGGYGRPGALKITYRQS